MKVARGTVSGQQYMRVCASYVSEIVIVLSLHLMRHVSRRVVLRWAVFSKHVASHAGCMIMGASNCGMHTKVARLKMYALSTVPEKRCVARN